MTALLVGAAIWWLQVYAFYEPVSLGPDLQIRLTPIAGGAPETIVADDFEGIDASSSPIRFRGCFTTPLSLGLLTETYRIYETATPLVAPAWFGCFDAGRLTEDLKTGRAVAFLAEENVAPDVDRVVAVYPDGHAYTWNQLNAAAAAQAQGPAE